MRIRFKGAGEHSASITQGAGRLREDCDYPVLEVFAVADSENLFRVEAFSGETPGLYDSRLFEVIDGSIPLHWVASVGARGDITLGPAEWVKPGFWDAFFDGERWAVDLYQSEKNKPLK
ncbi:hypothetical protein ACWGJX_10200 [Streptomyces sp. NPDC054775]